MSAHPKAATLSVVDGEWQAGRRDIRVQGPDSDPPRMVAWRYAIDRATGEVGRWAAGLCRMLGCIPLTVHRADGEPGWVVEFGAALTKWHEVCLYSGAGSAEEALAMWLHEGMRRRP